MCVTKVQRSNEDPVQTSLLQQQQLGCWALRFNTAEKRNPTQSCLKPLLYLTWMSSSGCQSLSSSSTTSTRGRSVPSPQERTAIKNSSSGDAGSLKPWMAA